MGQGLLTNRVSSRSNSFSGSRDRKDDPSLRRRKHLVSLAAQSVIPELLERRTLFSGTDTEHLGLVLGPAYPPPTPDSTAFNLHVTPKSNSVFKTKDGSLVEAIAGVGFILLDNSEQLDGLTESILRVSDLPSSISSTGLASDQEVLLVQWTGTTTGNTSNGTITATTPTEDSPLNLVYAPGGGYSIYPLLGKPDQDANHCNCDDNQYPADLQTPDQCQCDQMLGNDTAPASVAGVVKAAGALVNAAFQSLFPVNYSDGVIDQSETDLSSNGFGSSWGITRNWTNNLESSQQTDAITQTQQFYSEYDPSTDVFGNNVVENQLPRLINTGSSFGIATNGNDTVWFDSSGSFYLPRFYNNGSLGVGSTEIDWTDETGQVTGFYGYDSSIPTKLQGKFKFYNDAQGISTSANYNTSTGLLDSVGRTYTDAFGVTYNESYGYSYSNISSGSTTITRVNQIQLSRNNSSATTVDYVQTVQYAYYGGGDANGNLGDLKSATTYDGSGPSVSGAVNTDYYRYYTSDTYVTGGGGYVGGLKMVFTGANYARMIASLGSTSLDSASDSSIAPYANTQYAYDSDERVVAEVVGGAGATQNGSGGASLATTPITGGALAYGQGLYTYAYNTSTNSLGANAWQTRTILTSPNGKHEIVYTNASGQVMLDIQDPSGTSPTDSSVRITDYQYNDSGQVTQVAQPNAFQQVSGSWYNDSNADPSTGYISSSSGGIETINYYNGSSTLATTTTAGGVVGYEQSIDVSQGTSGSQQEQESWTYIGHNSSAGATVYALASDTTYGLANGSDPRTTSYSYSWYSGTNAVSTATTTLPMISYLQNGANSSNSVIEAFNTLGMLVWAQNPNGRVSYDQYDVATGGLTLLVNDVAFNYSGGSWNSAYGAPTGFNLSAGGLNLATSYTVDDQGRPTVEVTPAGNTNYFRYDDPDHEVREFDGWVSGAPTGPTKIYREDWADGFTETLTTTDTPDLTANELETLTAGNIQSLSRTLLNATGQTVETDDYFGLSGVSYNASTPHLGLVNIAFYRTTYDYDVDGNPDRTVDPNGTITRAVYDSFDEPVSTWVGTSEGSTASSWTLATSGSQGNMVEVSAAAYDVDGNTTETASYPGNGSSGRASVMFYDYRDRLIATMTGAVESSATPTGLASADSSSHDTFVSYYTLDNASETTTVATYNAEGHTPTSGTGPVSGMLLTAESAASYDDLGQVFSTSVISVDPSSGTPGSSLTTNNYYDPDGNLVATINPTGAATKYAYDGVDRNTLVYLTDGGKIDNASNVSSNAYAAARNVSNDIVLTQTQFIFDGDGNVIETVTSNRFDTDLTSSSATGALHSTANTSTGAYARVSYTASYFDAADRDIADLNVGTNGSGGSWSPPSYSSLTRSGTTLLTTTTYNPSGWVDTTTDPKGIVTKYKYNMLGETTETVANYNASSPSITDSANQTTDYTYDGDGHVLTMTANMPSGTLSQVTHYVYGVTTGQGSAINDNDLLYQVQYPDPNSGTTNTSTGTYNQSEGYTYDALGEQLTYTDRNGNAHTYSYDQLGRLTSDSVSVVSGVDNTVTKLGYAYNDQGLLSTLTSYNSGGGFVNQVVDTYDGFGQLISDAQAHAGNVSSGTASVGYTYNASNGDRLTAITYPDGRTINYNYNGNSGIDTILSRISSVSDSSGLLQGYSYLGLDTPVTFSDGNGVQLSYLSVGSIGDAGDQYVGLDRFGRVVSQNWTTSFGGTGPLPRPGVDQFNYGYDANSNVVYKQAVTNTGNGTINTTLAGQSQLYSYDNLNRLTNFSQGTLSFNGSTASITSPTSTQGWVLDAVGNWKSSSVNGTNTNRSNSAQNQVKTVGTATLAYDLNGNTTTDQIGQVYKYDAWNRLVKVTSSYGVVLASYAYDAEGRRITETHGIYPAATTTDLYYSNRWQVLQENVGSLVTAEHVWSPFYVDSMIQTVTNPVVTANQSNGAVDTGFGTNTSNHTTTTAIGGTPSSVHSALDGSDILVVTLVGTTPKLVFYNASGGLDTSFGSGTGIVSFSYSNWTSITGVVVQSNGYIDLAVQTSAGYLDVVQLNASGGVNTSFGNSSGIEVLSSLPAAQGLVQAANGDLLVDGVSGSTVDVTALNSSSGAVDSSYGTSGTGSFSFNSSASVPSLSMAVSPKGDLILLGLLNGSVSDGEMVTINWGLALAALTPSGVLDSAFGTAGITQAYLPNVGGTYPAPPSPVVVGPSGQIFVGTWGNNATGYGSPGGPYYSSAYALNEYNANGSVDTAFNGSATTGVSFSGFETGAILNIQINGQVVIGASGSNFELVRFNNDGSLDTTFGSGGLKTGAADSSGLAMVTAANGETVMVGTATSGSSLVLQEFGTLAKTQILYVEQDANYNVTSLTNSSGTVVERYSYDPYGNVTVLNPDGTLRGDGTAASSLYGSIYLEQGLRIDPQTGTYNNFGRIYDASLGRSLQQDPARYIDGANMYLREGSNPVNGLDPSGLEVVPKWLENASMSDRVDYSLGMSYWQIQFKKQHPPQCPAPTPQPNPNLPSVSANTPKDRIGQIDDANNFAFENNPYRVADGSASVAKAARTGGFWSGVGAAASVAGGDAGMAAAGLSSGTGVYIPGANQDYAGPATPLQTTTTINEPTTTDPSINAAQYVAAESGVPAGTNVTRNWGGNSRPFGQSWTTDPLVTQSRNSLGLETTNTGEFVCHGTVVDNADITTRAALPWGRFAGGGQETLVPSASTQIQLNAVTMPNDPLPWSLPTDPKPLPAGVH